jgi:FHS family L-fucose permease-like MFS transporter
MSTSTQKKGFFTLENGQNLAFTFFLVSSLFLLWGFCNGMIDVMDKHFQDELGLSKSQSAWVQFAHYLGYFLMSIPAGWLSIKLGYKGGIIAGLLIVAAGGMWFIPATYIQEAAKAGQLSSTVAFIGFLIGVCAIASGLTFLETIANPYTTVLGDPKYSATRINLAQSANGIGWVLGPIIGSIYFYSKDASGASTGSQTLYVPYVGIAAVVTLLAAIFYFAKVPDIKAKDDYHLDDAKPGVVRTIWSHPHFVVAVLAQFVYVAAQAGIFSFFINTMTPDKKTGMTIVPPIPSSWDVAMTHIANSVGSTGFFHDWLSGWFAPLKDGFFNITDKGAANMQSLGFICFVLGRFSGTALMKKFAAHRILGVYGIMNIIACFLIFMNIGWVSVACVFLSFFFMSIMFPTIFALGIFGLGERAKKASSYLVMAIMGGAVLPKLMGYIADESSMSRGYIVPMACFVVIALYGFCWPKLSGSKNMDGAVPAGGH